MDMEWISVNDELPRSGMYVMATAIDMVRNEKLLVNHAYYEAGRKEWLYLEGDISTPFWADKMTVTHWMRYPEPATD